MPQSPKRLYKYRAFSELSIQSLVDDKVFLANPATFNDPMDTRPVAFCESPRVSRRLQLWRMEP